MIPSEDLGLVRLSIMLPQGSSRASTDKVLYKVKDLLSDIPEINSMTLVSGFNMTAGQGPAGGNAVISLKPWDERER